MPNLVWNDLTSAAHTRLWEHWNNLAAAVRTAMAPGAWTNIPLLNGWTSYGVPTHAPQYRLVGDTIELRGAVKHATLTTVGNFARMPIGTRPPALQSFVQPTAADGWTRIEPSDTGYLELKGYFSGGNGALVFLDGIRWALV